MLVVFFVFLLVSLTTCRFDFLIRLKANLSGVSVNDNEIMLYYLKKQRKERFGIFCIMFFFLCFGMCFVGYQNYIPNQYHGEVVCLSLSFDCNGAMFSCYVFLYCSKIFSGCEEIRSSASMVCLQFFFTC